MSGLVALDLFAGTGWGVACRALGIEEHGVDNMPEVIATREANGMSTVFHDVWEGLDGRATVPAHHIQIASPPCQSFSMAGKGAGRQALVDVLRLIQEGVYRRPLELEHLTEQAGFDDRTALVLAPLAYAVQHQPYYIAWEQVPAVLPVWEACAEVLRAEGYSVWTGMLHSEQYGVPQTRKRAILMASTIGDVAPPLPTHSKFYPRATERLDAGVLPWISMAQALGWGMTERPYPTVATGSTTAGGGPDPAALGGSGARRNVYAERDAGRWAARGDAASDEPGGILRLEPEDAAILQSYPVTAVEGDASWVFRRPSPTIVGSFRPDVVAAPGYRKPGDPPRQKTPGSVLIDADQAAVLQSFPWAFEFKGNRSKQFLQIGNAVPPLMARAVLAALIGA